MGEFYDGTKLLSIKDIDGRDPEIYMCTSNRSAGKTTYFSRLIMNRYLKRSEKFMILFRFSYELTGCAEKFFKVINSLFFPGYTMSSKSRERGKFHDLYLTAPGSGKPAEHCGYAAAINDADILKKLSQYFQDVSCIFFDEFQSESNKYCPDEIRKFQSLHTTVARGDGKQYRRVPVYMVANPVSLINPYYTTMDISSRLNPQVKFLRGPGFVLEQGYNSSAANAQNESGFNRAFSQSSYQAYNMQGIYLNDSSSFIERPKGSGRYLATFRFHGKDFALRQHMDEGIIYCDDRPDSSYKYRITVTTDDHGINYVMLKSNDIFIGLMRFYFEKGSFRFKNIECKRALMAMLSY